MIQKNVVKLEKRNYGIDLLRILSMFFVLILHCLGQGGVLENATLGSHQYMIAWFIEIFTYCAVDIFALISGYVAYCDKCKKVNYKNLILLWLQVIFYGLLVCLIYIFISPELVNQGLVIQQLFPLTNDLYWYFTAYVGLFVVMPLINIGLSNCSKDQSRALFIFIFIVFSVFEKITNRFSLNRGYSFVWLMLLYILGGIIKKNNIGKNLKKSHALVEIIILTLIAWVFKVYGFEFEFMNVKIDQDIFVSYLSPTVLGTAIFWVIIFSKLKFPDICKKIIKFIAPTSFAIYLLNCHTLIWNNLLLDRFVPIVKMGSIAIISHIFIFSFIFLFISILIDRIRIKIFKILHIDAFANWVVNTIKHLLKINNV